MVVSRGLSADLLLLRRAVLLLQGKSVFVVFADAHAHEEHLIRHDSAEEYPRLTSLSTEW